jgi:hypothetical protein
LTTNPLARLLLVSRYQINALVPSSITGSVVNVQVTHNGVNSFTATSQATTKNYFPASVVTADPAIFTTSAAGQGQGAILNSDWTVNGFANQANHATTPTGTNGVHIYLTGLGAPTSVTYVSGNTCVALTDYWAAVNAATGIPFAAPGTAWISADGAVTLSSILNGPLGDGDGGIGKIGGLAGVPIIVKPPCFAFATTASTTLGTVTVSIGGTLATITYAGFVPDSIAGLYQIDATVPVGVTPPAANLVTGTLLGQVPVVVNVGSGSVALSNMSQAVYMFVK